MINEINTEFTFAITFVLSVTRNFYSQHSFAYAAVELIKWIAQVAVTPVRLNTCIYIAIRLLVSQHWEQQLSADGLYG
jgi:hypothetical protein